MMDEKQYAPDDDYHTCPECGREVKTHVTRFGDVAFNHHTRSPSPDLFSREAHYKLIDDSNPLAYELRPLDCPGSGLVVD